MIKTGDAQVYGDALVYRENVKPKHSYPQITVNEDWCIIRHDNGQYYMMHKECPYHSFSVTLAHIYTECVACGDNAPEDVVRMYRLITL